MLTDFPAKLRLLPDFSLLDLSECETILQLAKSLELNPFEVFLDFEQNLSGFILVVSGSLELLAKSNDDQMVIVTTLRDGAIYPCEIFNAEELSSYQIRASQENVFLQYIKKADILSFLDKNTVFKDKINKGHCTHEILNFFRKTENLAGIPSEGLAKLAEKTETQEFKAGAIAIKQGESEDSLFL